MTSIIGMQDHFTRVSAVYRKVRTTDLEPLNHITQELAGYWGLSSNGTEMYAKGVDRYLPEMRRRRIQE